MVSVILLMAGKGKRMMQDENKILTPINGKPLFMYSLELFLSFGFEVVCVISESDKDKILPLLPSGVKYTFGGKERYNSVYNGLNAINGDYVLIHDSARPFINKETIDNILKLKDMNKCILTYLNVKDTIWSNKDELEILNRSDLIAAVTPQCGPKELFKEGYKKAIEDNYKLTDDISVIRKYYPNVKIDLVLANDECFKITTPIDLKLAKALRGDFSD